ncbi:MAG: hypothetical protein ACC656_03220 [Candidatus Heimdallarchaeota archaeon]
MLEGKRGSYKPSIQSVFILDKAGEPLFARYYNIRRTKDDSVLLAAFLSAIEIFTTHSLEGQLTDLGLGDQRYFFGRSDSGFMFVASMTSAEQLFIDPSKSKIMQLFLRNTAIAFELLDYISKNSKIRISSLVSNFGTTIDSLILEATLEIMKIEGWDEESYVPSEFEMGKGLDQEEFQLLKELINVKTGDLFKN